MSDGFSQWMLKVQSWLEYAKEQGIEGLGEAIPAPSAPVAGVAPTQIPQTAMAASPKRPAPTPTATLTQPNPPAQAGPPLAPLTDAEKRSRMSALEARTQGCEKCALATGRTNLVFGVGDPASPVVFVGEGPGADEDAQGVPFVGRAGRLLTLMIESIGWEREQVYICNVVKCRPPGNRNPESSEAEACWPYLAEQIEILQPKLVVGLGKVAIKRMTGKDVPISRAHGQLMDLTVGRWRGKFFPTFHPAFLLRSPGMKREAMRDMYAIAELAQMKKNGL